MNLFTPKRETWLHRVNPALKLILFLFLLVTVLITRRIDFVCYQLFAYLLLLTASGHPRRRVLLLLSPFVLIFISSASTLILFGKGDSVWWQWGLIKISEESFYHGILIGFKTLCFGVLGLVFALSTKPVLFFYAMMQQLRLPAKYAYSFIASIRLLPMVWEDFHNRKNALQVRGYRYRKGLIGYYDRLRAYAVPLMAQSIRRASRVAVAMEAKRFQMGASRTYYYVTRYSRLDAVFITLMLGLFMACYLLPDVLTLFGR